MRMETVEDMDKILAILNKTVEERKEIYLALPRLKRTAEDCRLLAQQNHDEYVALLKREKVITDNYFNSVQMQEWASAHKRWIETGLEGYTTHELSPVGKEILANFISNLEVTCE